MTKKAATSANLAPAKPDRNTRIERCVSIMQRGEWVRGVTAGELGREWGIPKSTVENDASDAWRIVVREAKDVDAVTDSITTALSRTLAKAEAEGEHSTVAKVADVWSRIVGARAPERHEHAVVVAQFNALSSDEKIRQIEHTIGELQAAVKALRARK